MIQYIINKFFFMISYSAMRFVKLMGDHFPPASPGHFEPVRGGQFTPAALVNLFRSGVLTFTGFSTTLIHSCNNSALINQSYRNFYQITSVQMKD